MNQQAQPSATMASEPAGFPRRVLLAVSGLTPQVVTETLYALAADDDAPFVPTEVHLITSAELLQIGGDATTGRGLVIVQATPSA